MNTFLRVSFLVLMFPLFAKAAPVRSDFTNVGVKEIQEEDVKFLYSSSDGTIELKCTHVFDKPELHDWDVWCGKGTNLLKQFRVHFLARQYKSRSGQQSALEVLYWVIDRNQPLARAFSSTSSWIQYKNLSNLETLSFSQGVENDYAFLKLDFTPRQ